MLRIRFHNAESEHHRQPAIPFGKQQRELDLHHITQWDTVADTHGLSHWCLRVEQSVAIEIVDRFVLCISIIVSDAEPHLNKISHTNHFHKREPLRNFNVHAFEIGVWNDDGKHNPFVIPLFKRHESKSKHE